MRGITALLLALLLARTALALDNCLGLTPLLGFNSWVRIGGGASVIAADLSTSSYDLPSTLPPAFAAHPAECVRL